MITEIHIEIILTINFSQPLRKIFLPAGFSISFPELITSRGFVTPAQESKAINLFLHPGTILIISSLISFVFLKNKGYPTADHRLAIREHGPCPIHRRTYKGVREYLEQDKTNPPSLQKGLW